MFRGGDSRGSFRNVFIISHSGCCSFCACFQVERTSGSDGLSSEDKRKRRTKKGRAYTEKKQQFSGALFFITDVQCNALHALGAAREESVDEACGIFLGVDYDVARSPPPPSLSTEWEPEKAAQVGEAFVQQWALARLVATADNKVAATRTSINLLIEQLRKCKEKTAVYEEVKAQLDEERAMLKVLQEKAGRLQDLNERAVRHNNDARSGGGGGGGAGARGGGSSRLGGTANPVVPRRRAADRGDGGDEEDDDDEEEDDDDDDDDDLNHDDDDSGGGRGGGSERADTGGGGGGGGGAHAGSSRLGGPVGLIDWSADIGEDGEEEEEKEEEEYDAGDGGGTSARPAAALPGATVAGSARASPVSRSTSPPATAAASARASPATTGTVSPPASSGAHAQPPNLAPTTKSGRKVNAPPQFGGDDEDEASANTATKAKRARRRRQ